MTYLFLAIPNFSGSTLVHSLLASCPDVVRLTEAIKWNNRSDFVEGNTVCDDGYYNLLGPHSIEANMEHVYSDPANYDWGLIKSQWDKNWSERDLKASIRMQKSVCDIFRVKMMSKHFENLKWVVSVRNPYAHAASIIRQSTFQLDAHAQLDQICFHVLRSLEVQLENIKFLNEKAYVMTHEDFVDRTKFHIERMGEFIPGLEKVNFDKELMIKGVKSLGIHNNNDERIAQMVATHPDILDRINHWFKPMEHLLNAWGYELRHS